LAYTGGGPQADLAILATVVAACRDHEVIIFDYTTRRGTTGRRRIEPHSVVAAAVLRFGLFYGPAARHSEEFLELARRGLCVMLGLSHTYVCSIHVADGGAAVAAALSVPAGTYNVVDDEPLTRRAYADALAAAAHRRVWLRVPGRAALLLGDRSRSLTRSLRVSNAHFRKASGWAPVWPSARVGWIETAKALIRRPG
jgi:nucleoside-diphosphate-sugar epimerase